MRLGYLTVSGMKNLSNLQYFTLSTIINPYDVCSKARRAKLPYPTSTISTKAIFQLIHVVTPGPYRTSTYDCYRYVLTIADDFSRRTWTYLLKTKSNDSPILKYFIALVERQFNTKVQIII